MARIEDYGLIGDLQTAALVSTHGSIDWLCFPRFDSGACFAALLGDAENGHWTLQPAGEFHAPRRRYVDDTLILETNFETSEGSARLIDFMPPRETTPDVVRIVEGVEGRVEMRMELALRFDYGSVVPWVRTLDGALVGVAGPDAVVLRTPVELEGRDFRTYASFTVSKGDRVPFVLTWFRSHESPPTAVEPEAALKDTGSYWEEWAARCTHSGRWHDDVHRSVLTLKALTYAPDGRGRGSADDVTARGARRRPQLGLPLLLAARRDAHAPGTDPVRLRRGGGGVAGLAAPGGSGQARGPADHVRRRRRAATDGARASLACRVRRLAAGANRQRRVAPASARRLRRAHRRPLPGAASRPGRIDRTTGRSVASCSTGSSPAGARRITESGRCAVRDVTSHTRR